MRQDILSVFKISHLAQGLLPFSFGCPHCGESEYLSTDKGYEFVTKVFCVKCGRIVNDEPKQLEASDGRAGREAGRDDSEGEQSS